MGAANDGQGERIMEELADAPRLKAVHGPATWVKLQHVLRETDYNVVVHYFRNVDTGLDVEFK